MKASVTQYFKSIFFAVALTTTTLGTMPPACHALALTTLPDFTQVADKCMPCVVSIKAERLNKKGGSSQKDFMDDGSMDSLQEDVLRRFFGLPPQQQRPERRGPALAMGSGFLISSDGYILTNNHVIEDSSQITVTFEDLSEYDAQLIGSDPNTDVALLKINGKGFPYLNFATAEPKTGQWAAAIGSPLGLQGSFTVGVVSNIKRTDLDILPIEEFIQTDATMNVGNSGGPLVNLDGDVMGMNAAIAVGRDRGEGGGGSIGIGFTIPSKILIRIKDELMQHGKVVRGFLGVMLQKVDNDLAKLFGLSKAEGALVTDVVEGGPADQAGIVSEDIILKVNGKSIENPSSLRNFISLLEPGQKAILTVKRGDKEIEVKVAVGTHPEQEATATQVQNDIGMLVQELTPELASQLGYKDEKGVVIKYITPNSAAQAAGLKRGQLIISVNRKPVATPTDFYRITRERSNDSQLLLLVKEGSATRFVILKLQ